MNPTDTTIFGFIARQIVKATLVGEIGGNMLQIQFFQMLPTDFTKQEAIEPAKVLGVNVRTMEDWLEKMIKQASIERVMKGIYQKISRQIA